MHKLEKKQRVFAILQLHAMKHQTTHQIQNLIQLPLQSISSITRSKKKAQSCGISGAYKLPTPDTWAALPAQENHQPVGCWQSQQKSSPCHKAGGNKLLSSGTDDAN